MLLVNFLPFADNIIALSSTGNILEHGSFSDLSSNEAYVQSLRVQESQDSILSIKEPISAQASTFGEPPEKSIDGNFLGADRQVGDLAVYSYYFKSIGLLSTLVFFVAEIAFTFFEYFPCKSSPLS